ncbi:MAG: peptide chain release factor aRF-1 [archaeon]
MPQESKEMYEFRKQLKFLKKQRGQGTELISVYIKPGANVNEVSNRLRDEYGQAANIKSKSTRKNVQAAIDRILTMLKGVSKPPEHGVAIFSGMIGNNVELFTIIPPDDIQVSIYRCDSTFFTEPLEDMYEQKDVYGLVVMDRREATFAYLKGKKTTIFKHITSTVPGKHHKGGQSAMRMQRLIEQATHEFFVEIGEICNESFAGKEVKAVIFGGPGPTKYSFLNGDYLFNNVKEKIKATPDTSYTDEFGIREVQEKASDVIKGLEVAAEKEMLDKFLKEAVTNGLATYGFNEVKTALENGQADKLLLSEGVDEAKINELTEIAERMGTHVEMISEDTSEGQQFLLAFAGIGAFLRYKTH